MPAVEAVGAVAPPCAVHALLNPVVGVGPADASARRQADPDGVPAPPFPFASFAPKSSETEDHDVPQLVPRLTSVGTPGVASAVVHADRMVGSSMNPTPSAPPPKSAHALAIRFERTVPSDTETSDCVASALAVGPDVVGDGTEPLAEGSGSDVDALSGAEALVPGPVAVVELVEGPVELGVVVELDAAIGSLIATVAGPASPPLADPDPPTVEL